MVGFGKSPDEGRIGVFFCEEGQLVLICSQVLVVGLGTLLRLVFQTGFITGLRGRSTVLQVVFQKIKVSVGL